MNENPITSTADFYHKTCSPYHQLILLHPELVGQTKYCLAICVDGVFYGAESSPSPFTSFHNYPCMIHTTAKLLAVNRRVQRIILSQQSLFHASRPICRNGHRSWETTGLNFQQDSYQENFQSQQRSFHGSQHMRILFDPLRVSSASVLKQPNEDLTPEEICLKERLQAYQEKYGGNPPVRSDDELGQGQLLDDLLQAYVDLEYWSEALGIEQTKCQKWFQEGTDEYADSIHAQGKFCLRQEDFKNSKALYDQSLAYFEASGNSVQQGHVLISLAGWYYFRSQLDEAMKHLERAEALLDSNPALLVKCLDNQGLIFRLYGEFDKALDKYQQALQVVVDDETQYALQLHVADMLVALEEPEQALSLYEDLVNECRRINPGMEGVLWHNIATLRVDQGAYELALEEFRRALRLKQESAGEEHPEVAKTWNSLGALHYGILDEKVQALECFQHALWIVRMHAEDPQTDPDVLAALQTISDIEYQIEKET